MTDFSQKNQGPPLSIKEKSELCCQGKANESTQCSRFRDQTLFLVQKLKAALFISGICNLKLAAQVLTLSLLQIGTLCSEPREIPGGQEQPRLELALPSCWNLPV